MAPVLRDSFLLSHFVVLSVVSIRKRRDLTSQIEEKEAEIAKLQKRKKAVMQKCGKADHAGMQEIQQQIAMAKATIQHVDDRQNFIHETIFKSKRSFLDLLNKVSLKNCRRHYLISCSKLSNTSALKNSPSVISKPSQSFLIVFMFNSFRLSSNIL